MAVPAGLQNTARNKKAAMKILPPLIPSKKVPASFTQSEKRGISKSFPLAFPSRKPNALAPLVQKSKAYDQASVSRKDKEKNNPNLQVVEFVYSKAVEKALRKFGFWSSKPDSCRQSFFDVEVPDVPSIHEEIVFMRKLRAQRPVVKIHSGFRTMSRPFTNLSYVSPVSRVIFTRQSQGSRPPTKLPAIEIATLEDQENMANVDKINDTDLVPEHDNSFVTESVEKMECEPMDVKDKNVKKNKTSKSEKKERKRNKNISQEKEVTK